MKKFIITCAVAGALVSQADVVTNSITATQDTYLRRATPTADSGNMVTLMMWQGTSRPIMEYDLSGITGEITSVTLNVVMSGSKPNAWGMSVSPMVYTANNYSWVEGVGTTQNNTDALTTGSACHTNRNGNTFAAWEDSTGTALNNAESAALWDVVIGSTNGAAWVGGTTISITLDAATVEYYRDNYGKIVLGLSNPGGEATDFTIFSKDESSAWRHPTLTIVTVPEPASIGLLAISAVVLMLRRKLIR